MNIYVGNLSYTATDTDLRDTFSPYGTVESARVITDKFTGQARGFGFVEMPNDDEARAAIAAMDGKDMWAFYRKKADSKDTLSDAEQRDLVAFLRAL